MGYIRETKKAGVYEASFVTPRETLKAAVRYKREKWMASGGEAVRFAYTDIPLPKAAAELALSQEIAVEPVIEELPHLLED